MRKADSVRDTTIYIASGVKRDGFGYFYVFERGRIAMAGILGKLGQARVTQYAVNNQ